MTTERKTGLFLLGGLLLILLWLLTRKKQSTEIVTTKITPIDTPPLVPVSTSTGEFRTFDSTQGIPPHADIIEAIRMGKEFPWSCPPGYQIWFDSATSFYWCIMPQEVAIGGGA